MPFSATRKTGKNAGTVQDVGKTRIENRDRSIDW
jgi:hypothetical protein